MSGQRIIVETCVHRLARQMWIYNSNGRRIISIFIGLKGVTVMSDIAKKKNKIKALLYSGGKVINVEMWEILYDTSHIAPSRISSSSLYVPYYNTFRLYLNLKQQI